MLAQQTSLDNIANNLANVNTTGFKSQSIEFKNLLYQTLQTKTTSANGDTKPGHAQVGLGTRVSSLNTSFSQGSFFASENDTAFAIGGNGFFGIKGGDGKTYYTRNGNFGWTLASNGGNMLATSDGNPVLDTKGNPIILDSKYTTSRITVTNDGQICYPDEKNNPQPLGITIGLWQFNNPTGLERVGDTSFMPTAASGQAMNEATTANLRKSEIRQGYLEGSNVNVATEMVNLIVAQRAYEMNSKAITTTDEMMQTANNLKR
jgi:flagellar basal-body rod protein FlgG